MKRQPSTSDRTQFLSGWKEIANYLKKGVRTVQRYERELGLPVRRPAARDKGAVVAVIAELDGWVKASPIREAFHLRTTPSEHALAAETFKKGLADLATLQYQMSMLRSELMNSVQRLRDSVQLLQGQLVQGESDQDRTKYSSSPLRPRTEQDLFDRTAADLMAASVKISKPS